MPTTNDAENKARQDEERRRARAATGRGATIVTGGLGDTSFGTSVQKVTLLGQAA